MSELQILEQILSILERISEQLEEQRLILKTLNAGLLE